MKTAQTKYARPTTRSRPRRGMALLVVLFIVAAVISVSSAILYRADLAAAAGHNYALRTQADYIAWAGLEHARALIRANPDDPNDPANPNNIAPYTLDEEPIFSYYISSIGNPTIVEGHDLLRFDDISCTVYYIKSSTTQPYSKLTAAVLYDPNDPATCRPKAWLTGIRRTQ